ncbi:MAG: hypothetical protein JRJ19_03415, partial [Deltaproteobacteria bacterium]|nr:hypothetical protein [Deltaproteobacteria bacterium]
KIEADLAARGMQIEKLLTEKGTLTKERTKMSEEQKKLASQIQELNRMKAAAEKRSADYRNLLNKLRKMIDAGTLQVKIRNGRMLVQMSSDVVFPPASTRIKPEAKVAIEELAMTIATFAGRKFQVLGHSDSTPIRSARFPSNAYRPKCSAPPEGRSSIPWLTTRLLKTARLIGESKSSSCPRLTNCPGSTKS